MSSYKLPPPPPGLPGSTPTTKGKTVALPEWATNIPGRRPLFKIHENRGQAMNALTYTKRQGQLLRLNQSKSAWEIVVDTTPLLTQPTCAWCPSSLIETRRSGWADYIARWRWEIPGVKLVAICRECDYRGGPPLPETKLDEVVEQAVAEGAAAVAASDAVLDEALKEDHE